MAKWFDDWGTEFESEEEAREHTRQNMPWEAYKNEFQYIVSYDELLDWAKDGLGFEEHFSDAIMQAENEYLTWSAMRKMKKINPQGLIFYYYKCARAI